MMNNLVYISMSSENTGTLMINDGVLNTLRTYIPLNKWLSTTKTTVFCDWFFGRHKHCFYLPPGATTESGHERVLVTSTFESVLVLMV